MYEKLGARRGAWLTKTYGLGKYSDSGITAVERDSGSKWKWIKNYLREDLEKTIQDFERIRKYSATVSRNAKEAIKKAYDWTGVWGAGMLGFGGAALCLYATDGPDWFEKVLGGITAVAFAKTADRVEKKLKACRRDRESNVVSIGDARNLRDEVEISKFTRGLAEGRYAGKELEHNLEMMETYLGNDNVSPIRKVSEKDGDEEKDAEIKAA